MRIENLLLITVIGLSAFISFPAHAQNDLVKDAETGLYTYQEVITADSVSKQELYSRAKSWFLKTLKSSDNIIELDDKGYDAITGSGNIMLQNVGSGAMSYVYNDGKLNFKVTVDFKEGKFRYNFSNFTYSAEKLWNGNYNGSVTSPLELLDIGKKGNAAVLADVNAKMKALINSFKAAVIKSKSDNW